MLKISTRITLWYVMATGVIIIVTGIAMYYIYDVQRRAAVDTDLKDYADFLMSGLGNESNDLSDIFDELLRKKDVPVSRIRSHRFVLASNDSIIFEPNIKNIDSLLEVYQDRDVFRNKPVYTTVEMNNTDYRLYSIPIKMHRVKNFHLVVLTSLDKVYESLALLRSVLFIISPAALIAAGIIGFFIARRSLAPVRNITKTAAAISSESLDKRVPIGKSQDELAILAKTFNEMIDRLDKTFKSHRKFIADVSHDIRTPLTVIQMELDLINTQSKIDNKTIETVQRCLKEVYRLNQLVDNLLILARADANQLVLNKKPFRLDEMIVDSASQLKNLALQKNIALNVNVSQPVEIKADESMIHRVITNILDNAIKFSPQNETISINIMKKDSQAVFSVTNKGELIPENKLKQIFDRFERGDKSRTTKGFGLGLAIVKTLVEAHNGKINVTSSAEKGTAFEVALPEG